MAVPDARPVRPVEEDSRGILDPWLLRERVQLTRYPAGLRLVGLVDRFWAVEWSLPDGVVHRQEVLTHPGANFSVGPADARTADSATGPRIAAELNGVARQRSSRVLAGHGWAVAAMTTPGGLGAFLTEPATAYTNRVVPMGSAVGIDDEALVAAISAEPDQESRVAVLRRAMEQVLVAADPETVAQARRVAEVSRIAERDRSVRRLGDLCERAGIGPRTLQRLFDRYVGVSPMWVLRRYRLLDAAEQVRNGQQVSWAEVAAELGYADQAHLIREFRSATGQTPAAYADSQRDG